MPDRDLSAKHKAREAAKNAKEGKGGVETDKGIVVEDTNAAASVGKPDLNDPTTQFRILSPEEMRYTLEMPDGELREIAIRTEFTMRDIHELRIFDALDSFAKLVTYEIAQVDGIIAGRVSRERWGQRLEVAMARPNVREEARRIIAMLARFVEPFEQTIPGAEKPVERTAPTLDEVAFGIDPTQMLAVSLFLVNRLNAEVERRKNARRTAPTR
jgi:hypothetical protein